MSIYSYLILKSFQSFSFDFDSVDDFCLFLLLVKVIDKGCSWTLILGYLDHILHSGVLSITELIKIALLPTGIL